MTFAETDYSGLISEIERILDGKNPYESVELIKELLRIHRKISLYPGLVSLVGKSIKEEVETSELLPGEYITWSEENKHYAGIVESKNEDSVVVNPVFVSSSAESLKLNKGKVIRLRRDALMRSWPSLVFPEKVKMSKTGTPKSAYVSKSTYEKQNRRYGNPGKR